MKTAMIPFLSITALCLTIVVTSTKADEPTKPSTKDGFVQYYSYFHGTWKVEETKEEKTETSQVTIRSSQGGCNIATGKGHTTIWGYNPKTGQWAGIGQMEDGSRSLLWVSKPKDERIGPGTKFQISGPTNHADGSVTRQSATFTCIDQNHYEIKITQKTDDGKALPDITQTVTRINCEPNKRRLRLRR